MHVLSAAIAVKNDDLIFDEPLRNWTFLGFSRQKFFHSFLYRLATAETRKLKPIKASRIIGCTCVSESQRKCRIPTLQGFLDKMYNSHHSFLRELILAKIAGLGVRNISMLEKGQKILPRVS